SRDFLVGCLGGSFHEGCGMVLFSRCGVDAASVARCNHRHQSLAETGTLSLLAQVPRWSRRLARDAGGSPATHRAVTCFGGALPPVASDREFDPTPGGGRVVDD